MERKYIDSYKEAIDVWGIDAQIRLCIEEMSELTKELCKYYRNGEMNYSLEQKKHIQEEIADVQNMVDQMQYIFGEKEVDEFREFKIDRTNKKLKKIKEES